MGSQDLKVELTSHQILVMVMKSSLVLLGMVVAIVQAKFCPGEKNGNQCTAGDKAYKCGVFFENLTSKRKLTWIGALPDALRKAKNKEEVADILGADVTEESFNNFPSCEDTTANARCYATLNKQSKVKLDSCDRNLINTSGSQTIGDYLCAQVKRWLRNSSSFKADGIRDLKLPFYYSTCGGSWTPVSSKGEDLYAKQPLCCNPDGTHFNCDGDVTTTNKIC